MQTKNTYDILWIDHSHTPRLDQIAAFTAQQAYQYWCNQLETHTTPHNISLEHCRNIAVQIIWRQHIGVPQRLKVLHPPSTQQPYINAWFDDIDYQITNLPAAKLRAYCVQHSTAYHATPKLFTCLLIIGNTSYISQVHSPTITEAFAQWRQHIQQHSLAPHTPAQRQHIQQTIADQTAPSQPSPLIHHDTTWHWYIRNGHTCLQLYIIDTAQHTNPADTIYTLDDEQAHMDLVPDTDD